MPPVVSAVTVPARAPPGGAAIAPTRSRARSPAENFRQERSRPNEYLITATLSGISAELRQAGIPETAPAGGICVRDFVASFDQRRAELVTDDDVYDLSERIRQQSDAILEVWSRTQPGSSRVQHGSTRLTSAAVDRLAGQQRGVSAPPLRPPRSEASSSVGGELVRHTSSSSASGRS